MALEVKRPKTHQKFCHAPVFVFETGFYRAKAGPKLLGSRDLLPSAQARVITPCPQSIPTKVKLGPQRGGAGSGAGSKQKEG